MTTHSWPVLSHGNPNLPALVFLHGFMGRGDTWLPIARELESDWHCLLPDIPGHGRALPLPAETLSFNKLCLGLKATLTQSGVTDCVLLGYSLGGRLALHFALQFPEMVRALVLESASPGIQSPEERAARTAADDRQAALIRAAGMPAFLEHWYRAPLFVSLATRPALLESIRQRNAANDPEAMARVLAELSPGRMLPLWERLGELSLPTLLIAGSLDTRYAELLTRARTYIPEARLNILPDVGHNAHEEDPAAFTTALSAFLNELVNRSL